MERYLAIKRNEIQIEAIAWMTLEARYGKKPVTKDLMLYASTGKESPQTREMHSDKVD